MLLGSDSARRRSGSFGFWILRLSHATAKTKATRPTISRIRLPLLIAVLLESSSRPSEVDLRKAGEGPEIRVREAVEPERIRVAREARHLGVVSGVLREREQVAPDHADPQAADAEVEPLDDAAIEGVADVQLLDLHVCARLHE